MDVLFNRTTLRECIARIVDSRHFAAWMKKVKYMVKRSISVNRYYIVHQHIDTRLQILDVLSLVNVRVLFQRFGMSLALVNTSLVKVKMVAF